MKRLPSDWHVEPLGSTLMSIQPGFASGQHSRDSSGLAHLRPMNINRNGYIDLTDVRYVENTGTHRVISGDVLFNNTNSPGLVGKVALYSMPEERAFSNHMTRLRFDPDAMTSSFAHWQLYSLWLEGYFTRICANHVNQASVSRSRLQGTLLVIPPLAAQLRIVDILESHISHLDAAEKLLQRNALRLKRYGDSLIRVMLTGKDLGQPLHPASLSGAEADDGHLQPMPMGWYWRRLGDIADITGGITKDSKNQSNPGWREVPYLRVANVQRGRLDLSSIRTIKAPVAKIESLRLQPGDVLLNEGGDRDKLARGWVWEGQIDTCIHQNHVFRARVRDGAIEPRLLSWAANTFGGPWAERNGKQTTNLASISMKRIRLMPIPVPPRDVQAGLVEALDAGLQQVTRLVATLETTQQRHSALRRAVLAAAFSGRLTGHASDLDQAEEMAGVSV